MRELRDKIGERSARLDRIGQELHTAEQSMQERDQFHAEHALDRARLDAVQSELERHMARRVERRLADPSDYHLSILGEVPAAPDHQAIWKRGAAILESDDLGVDHDPTAPERTSMLGTRHEAVEVRARLEVAAIPREHEPVYRSVEQDVGLDLF